MSSMLSGLPYKDGAPLKTVLVVVADKRRSASQFQEMVARSSSTIFLLSEYVDALEVTRDFLPDLLLIDEKLSLVALCNLYSHLRSFVEREEMPNMMISSLTEAPRTFL